MNLTLLDCDIKANLGKWHRNDKLLGIDGESRFLHIDVRIQDNYAILISALRIDFRDLRVAFCFANLQAILPTGLKLLAQCK